MAHIIVDHVIGGDDALISAKDDVARRNKWKVALQPLKLGLKGTGHVHRRGGNEHFILRHQRLDNFRAPRHDRNLSEKILGLKILASPRLMRLLDHLEDMLPMKMLRCESQGKFLVISFKEV